MLTKAVLVTEDDAFCSTRDRLLADSQSLETI